MLFVCSILQLAPFYAKLPRKGFCKKKRVVDEGISDEQSSIHFNLLEQVAGPSSTTAEEQTQTDLHSSAASRKLKVNSNDSTADIFDYGTDGTIFISTDILIGMMLETARCPECLQKVEVDYQLDSKVGLAHFFLLECPSCHWTKTYCTSRVIKDKTGHPTYEINLTSIIAFRECGVGYDGIKNFCGVVNMPPPMNKTAFQKSSKSIHNVYSETADLSMKQAAREVKDAVLKDDFLEDAVVDTCASFDGTW